MKTLFEPVKISQLTLKNRAVRSATVEYCGSEEGRMTEELANTYKRLAEGGVGTIITGMVGINGESCVLPVMIKAYGDAFVQDYRPVCDLVHAQDCKLIAQIAHCGAKVAHTDDGVPPVGPSESVSPAGVAVRALTKEDIGKIARDFAGAAVACKQAGLDGVQIHGAHGYLLSQFLSPTFNKRTDEYGGSIENRARIVFEVYRAIRDAVGADYPIWIKINSEDFTEDGMTLEESKWVCQELDRMDIDAIEVSGGLGLDPASRPSRAVKTEEEEEGSFVENAEQIARVVEAPIICVGGFRTLSKIEQALGENDFAAIALSRPLICEPDLIRRWQEGRAEKSKCISCNKCFTPKGGFGCQVFRS